MQRHNVKQIVKEVDEQNTQLKKHNLYLNILAASNLALWGIIIINYFL